MHYRAASPLTITASAGLGLCAALWLSARPAPVAADTITAPPMTALEPSTAAGPVLVVSGVGEVQRAPDFAVVILGVDVREPTATLASERAGKTIEEVTKAINELGLVNCTIQTSSVSLNPSFAWLREGTAEQHRKALGYDATSNIRVKVQDPRTIGRIMDTAVAAGANRIHGVTFELKAALEARQEAITLAAKAAREKANTLAAALGLTVDGVIEATTSNVQDSRYQPISQVSNLAAPGAAAPEGLGQSIEPGMVTVKAEVNVRYRAK